MSGQASVASIGGPVSTRLATATTALVALVAASTIVRAAIGVSRELPRYLPDEFLYPQLARSLASGDGVAVLGQHTRFPALLEPLLMAPVWAIGDGTAVPIALTQCAHALVMSLAAVPVYLVARTLGLSTRAGLGCAAVTTIAPALYFGAFLSADALGFLLALTAVAACVASLSLPGRACELAALASIGLAGFARVQYAVLLPAFAVGALAASGWSPGRALRSYPIVATIVSGLLLASPFGVGLLGRYETVAGFVPSEAALHWLFSGAFLLAVATGVAIVPGAVAWAANTVVRPADRARAGFAALGLAGLAMTLAMTSVLTVETSSDRFIERYLIVVAPLTAVAFACWLDEHRPARWLAIGAAVTLLLVAMRLTLAQFTVGQGVADSPTVFAVHRLEQLLDPGTASLVAALVVSAGALIALGTVLSRRFAATAWIFTGVLFVAVGTGAVVGDRATAGPVRALLAFGAPDWIDRSGASDVLLVQTPGSERFDAMVTALLNRSIVEAAPLGGLGPVSGFDGLSTRVDVDRTGTMLRRGDSVRRPVALATGGTAVAFTGAERVVNERSWALVFPGNAVRVSMLGYGIRSSGRLSQRGELRLYEQADGRCTRLTLRLSIPRSLPTTVLEFAANRSRPRIVRVQPGSPATVSWTSAGSEPTIVRFRTVRLGETRPSPFVATVANATWSVTPVACA